jgi:hypothetical protein
MAATTRAARATRVTKAMRVTQYLTEPQTSAVKYRAWAANLGAKPWEMAIPMETYLITKSLLKELKLYPTYSIGYFISQVFRQKIQFPRGATAYKAELFIGQQGGPFLRFSGGPFNNTREFSVFYSSTRLAYVPTYPAEECSF